MTSNTSDRVDSEISTEMKDEVAGQQLTTDDAPPPPIITTINDKIAKPNLTIAAENNVTTTTPPKSPKSKSIQEKNTQHLKLQMVDPCTKMLIKNIETTTTTSTDNASVAVPKVQTSCTAVVSTNAPSCYPNPHTTLTTVNTRQFTIPACNSPARTPPQSQKLFFRPGVIEEQQEEAAAAATAYLLQQDECNHMRSGSPLVFNTRSPYIVPIGSSVLNRVSTCNSSLTHIGNIRESRRFRTGANRKIRRRAILKNGDCNILQSRTAAKHRLRFLQDIFTTLVDAQWRWTLIIFALSFLLSWLGFAVIWWLITFTHGDFEPDHLPDAQEDSGWAPCVSAIHDFTSCFLFSIETQHTIGYGVRTTSEECPEAIFVMCLQSIAGVMIQAFMVGIVFAKMTRPKHRTQTLLFSRNAVICQRDGYLSLMFRVGDMRKSHIIGASIRAQLIRPRTTKEGETLTQYQTELTVNADGCDGDLFFIWPMTIVHRIDSDSPLYTLTAADMLQDRFEIVVILEGTIESTGQTTQARSSYVAAEVLWGHRFEPVVSYNKERQGYAVNYAKFDNTQAVDTPLCSGSDLSEFYRMQDVDSISLKLPNDLQTGDTVQV